LAGFALVTGCSGQAPVARRPHTGTATASEVGGIQQVTIDTGGDYRFHPSTVVVHPGMVKVILINQGGQGAGAPHTWQLDAGAMPFIGPTTVGTQNEASFTAPAPGRYTFECTLHRNLGQTGTLVVTNG